MFLEQFQQYPLESNFEEMDINFLSNKLHVPLYNIKSFERFLTLRNEYLINYYYIIFFLPVILYLMNEYKQGSKCTFKMMK